MKKVTANCGCELVIQAVRADPYISHSVVTRNGEIFHYRHSTTCEQHTGYGFETTNSRLAMITLLLEQEAESPA